MDKHGKKFENEDKPVLFINTSYMFEQFNKKATEQGKNVSGAALWAQYFYYYFRDKMWREQRAKFLFIVKETDLIEMLNYINQGFALELIPIYVKKQKLGATKKLSLTKSDDNK